MNVKELKVNKANPRTIRDHKFKKLVQSIQDFPRMLELRPIIIDTDGTILGGNMRYRAICELGYNEIPDNWVKRADKLTDQEKQRFIIEDNVEFGDWDFDMLANEWDNDQLAEWGLESVGEYEVDKFDDLDETETADNEEKIVIELPTDLKQRKDEIKQLVLTAVSSFKGIKVY